MKRTGFSLVELSIVLVILGLLVGGILAGQSLIRASELRSVTADIQRYQTALHAFRDKYFAVAGDMANATSFWGKNASYCNGHTGTANATTGTCNGDGDAQITLTTTVDITQEGFQLWRQLALAGVIGGTYTGISGATTANMPNINHPDTALSNSVMGINFYTYVTDSWNFNIRYGNQFWMLSPTGGGVLKPEEAWNMDSKLDDGMPATGQFIALLRASCTNATSDADFSTTYKLNNNALTACGLRYRNMI